MGLKKLTREEAAQAVAEAKALLEAESIVNYSVGHDEEVAKALEAYEKANQKRRAAQAGK